MKTILFRIATTLAAIISGVVLVSGMTLIGDKGAGPIDDLMGTIGDKVAAIEQELILNDRENSRAKSLKWFDAYRKDTSLLLHPKKILLGAYDNKAIENFESLIQFEQSIQSTLPIVQLYVAWGGKVEQEFPLTKARAITSLGSIPMITWEPWLTDFDKNSYPDIKNPENPDWGGMKAITNGEYDTYITKWAQHAKALNHPMFLRLGHEMNDPYRYPWGPQNNKPAEFVAAWKHVVDIFKKEKVENVLWVWAPHTAYGFYDEYYPGDNYVDWVGTGVLNYGTAVTWSQWWSFDDILSKFYTQTQKYNKPIMITEFGSLAVGGDRAEWYRKALSDLPIKYPMVKSLLFYHSSEDKTTSDKALNWYVKTDVQTTKAVVESLKNWSNK